MLFYTGKKGKILIKLKYEKTETLGLHKFNDFNTHNDFLNLTESNLQKSILTDDFSLTKNNWKEIL